MSAIRRRQALSALFIVILGLDTAYTHSCQVGRDDCASQDVGQGARNMSQVEGSWSDSSLSTRGVVLLQHWGQVDRSKVMEEDIDASSADLTKSTDSSNAEALRKSEDAGTLKSEGVQRHVSLAEILDSRKSISSPPKFWFQSKFPEPGYYLDEPFVEGPTQVDDLGMLYAVIKELRPATLVEVGAFKGDGSKILLSACDKDAMLFSFDPYPHVDVEEIYTKVPRSQYKLLQKFAENMTEDDIQHRKVDFAFLDASHKLESNKQIWRRLLPLLSETALVAIHDTGFWSKSFLDQFGAAASWRPGHVHGFGNKQYYLHPNHVDERRFVNWIQDQYPEYSAMHFHTLRYLRNGLTLLQKKVNLDADAPALLNEAFYGAGSSTAAEPKTVAQNGCSEFVGTNIICQIEFPEHKLVRDWIPKNATVMEFGARFGTTTCEIAHKQQNSGRLISVEPDATVWRDLQTNLASNNCHAHVLQGVVASTPSFMPAGNTFYNAQSSKQPIGVQVPIFKFDDIESALGLKVDTLLIDCEGCLPDLMEQIGPKLDHQIDLILLEADMPTGAPDCQGKCVDYSKFITFLIQHGFTMVDNFNDCDRAHHGAPAGMWCGPWIQHYAFRRESSGGSSAGRRFQDDGLLLDLRTSNARESDGTGGENKAYTSSGASRAYTAGKDESSAYTAGKDPQNDGMLVSLRTSNARELDGTGEESRAYMSSG